jgi:hypothetical protein
MPLQRMLDLPFAEVDGRELLLDVLRPQDRGDSALPGVIYVHGGGWATGHRTDTPNILLAMRGFVTVSISYRFSQEAVFPAALHDLKAAIRWVRANAADLGIDPGKLGIWGALRRRPSGRHGRAHRRPRGTRGRHRSHWNIEHGPGGGSTGRTELVPGGEHVPR